MRCLKEFAGGITNGNAWYPVHGGMQDYNYVMGNCLELTLELSVKKKPHASELPVLWEQNKNAFLDFAIAAAFECFRSRFTLIGERKCLQGDCCRRRWDTVSSHNLSQGHQERLLYQARVW